jgi:hypothetical protein
VLISEYNNRVKRTGAGVQIDDDIGELRNAFAHGRVLAANPSEPLVLLRFARPFGGNAVLERKYTLTPEWMEVQICRVRDVVLAVSSHLDANEG